MKATVVGWLHREEHLLAPYAAGAALSVALYVDTTLTTIHPSGQLDVALVMLGMVATQAVIVWLRKRSTPPVA
jgi:hypothetical protein